MPVQLVLPADSSRHRLTIAGVALVGASLIAVNPETPTTPEVQHRAVQLTTAEADWTDVLSSSETNLGNLELAATDANTDLSNAFTLLSGDFGSQISNAVTGFDTGIGNAISGGWYGSDDGYVFGLFEGTIATGADGPETGSTLAEISSALESGNTLQAFTDLDTYSLEVLDHTLKPLLSPLLDETSKGVTSLSIPVELSQLQTSLLETFGTYNELKAFSDALLAPELGVGFGVSTDIDNIATDLSSADYTQALTDLSNVPSDLTQDFLNGYPAGSESFPGLIADGGLLQELLVTFPEQLATALG
jgi:hypothetical protein